MKRKRAVLGTCVCILLACSCGKDEKQKPPQPAPLQESPQPEPPKKPPSLAISFGAEYKFGKDSVRIVNLVPTGEPSGTISLKSVQNGQAKSFATLQFEEMYRDGTLAIRITATGVDLGCDMDCSVVTLVRREATFPADATLASGGTSEAAIEGDEGEYVFWNKVFFTGERPSGWIIHSSFEKLLNHSKETPTMELFVLTLKIDNESQQTDAADKK